MAILLDDGNAPRRPAAVQFRLGEWIATAPFEDHVGITIEAADQGEARLTMPFRVCLANGGGVMHGGALVTLADTAVAMAIKSLLPPATVFATTELTTRFLAPVQEGDVTAHARVYGPEGRTFRGEADLLDNTGAVVAEFRCRFRIARGQGFDDLESG
jgi:uncharacterized protein (TIGR00369 family)